MSDGYIHNSLVERLRGKYSYSMDGIKEDRQFGTYTPLICEEAAGVIEQQAETIERLNKVMNKMRDALLEISDMHIETHEDAYEMRSIADEILNKLEAGEL